MVTTAPPLPQTMSRWLEWHAIAVLAGMVICLATGSSWPLSVVAGASFALGYWQNKPSWESAGKLGGPANLVTALRLLLMLAAGVMSLAWGPWALGILLGAAASLDGLDGEVARRFDAKTLFGEYFDKETDAFFVALGGIILWADAGIGEWILLPAILRPLYVFVRKILRTGSVPEPRFRWGRVIAVVIMVAIPVSLILPSPWQTIVLGTAVSLVCFSFARSFYWLIRSVKS